MKEMDLMKAMNELDGDLLREAEGFALKRRWRVLPKLAAAAAAVALLCGTVYAIASGVALQFGTEPDTIYVEDWGEYREYLPFQVSYVLEAVEIPEDSYARLQQVLDQHWAWSGEHCVWSGAGGRFLADNNGPVPIDPMNEEAYADYPQGVILDSLAQAEEFLDVALELPQDIRDAVRGEVDATIATPSLRAWEDANQVPDGVSPGALILRFGAAEPTAELEQVSVEVFLALTREGAEDPLVQNASYWEEHLGEPQLESRVYPRGFGGEVAVELLYYQPNGNHNGYVTAMYVLDGIGYRISATAAPDARVEDARNLILPWLDEVLSQ